MRPMVGTDGPLCQRLGSDAHQHPSRDGEIDFLPSARAGIVGKLLYGQLRPDRPGELRAEAFALRPHQPGRTHLKILVEIKTLLYSITYHTQ